MLVTVCHLLSHYVISCHTVSFLVTPAISSHRLWLTLVRLPSFVTPYQDGVIGAFLSAEDYEAYGAEYIFAGLAGDLVLAPVGQGIGQIVSDADITRPQPEAVWSSDSQYGETSDLSILGLHASTASVPVSGVSAVSPESLESPLSFTLSLSSLHPCRWQTGACRSLWRR
jgi:hypothetical protein